MARPWVVPTVICALGVIWPWLPWLVMAISIPPMVQSMEQFLRESITKAAQNNGSQSSTIEGNQVTSTRGVKKDATTADDEYDATPVTRSISGNTGTDTVVGNVSRSGSSKRPVAGGGSDMGATQECRSDLKAAAVASLGLGATTEDKNFQLAKDGNLDTATSGRVLESAAEADTGSEARGVDSGTEAGRVDSGTEAGVNSGTEARGVDSGIEAGGVNSRTEVGGVDLGTEAGGVNLSTGIQSDGQTDTDGNYEIPDSPDASIPIVDSLRGKNWTFSLYLNDILSVNRSGEPNEWNSRKIVIEDPKQEHPDNELDNTNVKERLMEFFGGPTERIETIQVWKRPLANAGPSLPLLHHNFAVFRTDNFYFSVEKLTKGLYIQRGKSESSVLNYFSQIVTERRRNPEEVKKRTVVCHPISDMVDSAFEQVAERYNLLMSNCQDFTKVLYDSMVKKASTK